MTSDGGRDALLLSAKLDSWIFGLIPGIRPPACCRRNTNALIKKYYPCIERNTLDLLNELLLQILAEMGNQNGVPVLREEDVKALARSSGLEESQVKEAFEAFLVEHPKGRMDPKDFSAMLSKALPNKASGGRLGKHIFRIYDTNDDGFIDFTEFMVIFHVMSEGTPEQVLAKIFRLFDINNDGTINRKEMARLIKDMYSLIKAADPMAESEERISQSAFAEMDRDGDGGVTCHEFVSACLEQEHMTRMLALNIIDIFVE